mgnify:CR=1 FL=1
MKKTVVAVGEILWDVLPDGAMPGGAPLNVAYHLNKLGLPTSIISKIGNDEKGLGRGAAGSTSWERCCLGLPTLMAVLADNQREAALYIEESGAAKLFYINEQLPGQLAALLLRCCSARARRSCARAAACAKRSTA